MLQADEIKKTCLAKWSENNNLDERLENFDKLFNDWIEQIPDEYTDIIVTLLKEINYFSREKTNKILSDLHQKLLLNQSISIHNTVYAYIKSYDGKTNSSNDYWANYKLLNKINRNICYENLNAICPDKWQYIDNIVFIDDFSGTGKSIITELDKHEKIFNGKNIYIITICIMEEAEEKLKEYGDINHINIVCIYNSIYKKAFQQNFFENNCKSKELYLDFTKYKKISCKLGYQESESLVAFYNNTPNNTLGFVHNKSEKYFPIFPRVKDEIPEWQKTSYNKMKAQKKQRKSANYNNITKDV